MIRCKEMGHSEYTNYIFTYKYEYFIQICYVLGSLRSCFDHILLLVGARRRQCPGDPTTQKENKKFLCTHEKN